MRSGQAAWRSSNRSRAGEALARRVGADRAVPPDDAAALQADVAVESAGRPHAVATAVRALRSGGRAVLLGLGTRPVSVLPMDLVGAEKSIIGSATQRSARGPVWATDSGGLLAAVEDGLALLDPYLGICRAGRDRRAPVRARKTDLGLP